MKTETVETVLVSREQFLGAVKRRFLVVPIPGLGPVRLRSLSEGERTGFEGSLVNRSGEMKKERMLTAKRRLIVLCVVDADGNPLLTSADLEAIEAMDGAITGALYDACREHCGFEKHDIEKLVGN